MKTLVLGLGNSILSDDSVGLQVAAMLRRTICRPDVTISQTELGGINLLELLAGYDQAIIVDAIQTRDGNPGQIYLLNPDSLLGTRHANSTHGIDFSTTLELGKKLGLMLPASVVIVAIEVEDVSNFSEECSPPVKRAIPICVEKISLFLGTGTPELTTGWRGM